MRLISSDLGLANPYGAGQMLHGGKFFSCEPRGIHPSLTSRYPACVGLLPRRSVSWRVARTASLRRRRDARPRRLSSPISPPITQHGAHIKKEERVGRSAEQTHACVCTGVLCHWEFQVQDQPRHLGLPQQLLDWVLLLSSWNINCWWIKNDAHHGI
jgi:hypothetical protein